MRLAEVGARVRAATIRRMGDPARQRRLRGSLATRAIGRDVLDQWQYEVTAGGRIWYCPDPGRRIVWVVAAGPAHPKATE